MGANRPANGLNASAASCAVCTSRWWTPSVAPVVITMNQHEMHAFVIECDDNDDAKRRDGNEKPAKIDATREKARGGAARFEVGDQREPVHGDDGEQRNPCHNATVVLF